MWLGHNKAEGGTEAAVASQVCDLLFSLFFSAATCFAWKPSMTGYGTSY